MTSPKYLFFDLETIPREGIDQFLPDLPEERPECEITTASTAVDGTVREVEDRLKAANYTEECLGWITHTESLGKRRKGVFDAIESCLKAKRARSEAIVANNKLASTTPELCQIVEIGMAVDDGKPVSMTAHYDQPGGEIILLNAFWKMADMVLSNKGKLVGYNCLAFDIPVIFARTAMLEINTPVLLIDTKPYGRDVLDLYKLRFPTGKPRDRPGKLSDLYQIYCDGEVSGVDGSQVLGLWEEKKYVELSKYVEEDVEQTRALMHHFRGLWFA